MVLVVTSALLKRGFRQRHDEISSGIVKNKGGVSELLRAVGKRSKRRKRQRTCLVIANIGRTNLKR